jgi:hypothetical protein
MDERLKFIARSWTGRRRRWPAAISDLSQNRLQDPLPRDRPGRLPSAKLGRGDTVATAERVCRAKRVVAWARGTSSSIAGTVLNARLGPTA